ncbi:nitroreductase family protein [Acinetobacter sp. GSS19]|uniref:nitroreductase family protein n=1 Tax=Acinetobacter sp. GSS19 TaxID=3020716 RepID=UPI00235F5185|nr:nitroreductase family protein [Acinetobacter sp. GSS19]
MSFLAQIFSSKQTPDQAQSATFLEQLAQRRTIYRIGKNVTQQPQALDQTIREAVRLSPSAFNSQSSRVVNLFGQAHQDFWDMVKEKLRQIVPAENFHATSDKIDSFAAGFATVLFFEDQNVVKGLQEQFAAYADNFPIWSEHSTAIAQFAVWMALSEQGLGASLQHYNPIVDEQVAERFGIPVYWKLRAQLVFGSVEAAAGEKDFIADDTRFKSFY